MASEKMAIGFLKEKTYNISSQHFFVLLLYCFGNVYSCYPLFSAQ